MNLHESLLATLVGSGISRSNAEAIVASAQPSLAISLRREENESLIPIGSTKVGGSPDLPLGTAWPCAESVELRFIAQVDLAQASALMPFGQLPRDGLLSFFWCQEHGVGMEPAGVRVLHTPRERVLERIPDPWATRSQRVGLFSKLLGKRPSARGQGFWPCHVEMTVKLSLPDSFGPFATKAKLTDEEFDLVFGGGLEKELAAAGVLLEGHRLLGAPGPIQGAVEYDAESDSRDIPANDPAESARLAAQWRLILQMNADHAPEFSFGDWGAIYFVMRETDICERRWDRARVVAQCH